MFSKKKIYQPSIIDTKSKINYFNSYIKKIYHLVSDTYRLIGRFRSESFL